MKKTTVFISALLLLSIIAGLYGIVHDIITYHISSEYFTRYTFIELGLTDAFGQPEISEYVYLAITGWMTTWWMGLIAGIVFGIFAYGTTTAQSMATLIARASVLMLGITVTFGVLGYIAGLLSNAFGLFNPASYIFFLDGEPKDVAHFNIAAFIHNFSYVGGGLGILLGCVWIVRQKRRLNAIAT